MLRYPDPDPRGEPMDTFQAAGMRRIHWIRIVDDGSTLTAEAIGIGHRLPVVRPIPLSVASALAARGVRTVVRSRRSE